jgi:hypothetical protein
MEAYSLPVEIQVRTAFEDAWGEIDHKLRYREKRLGKKTDKGLDHLNALKALVDGVSQYADIIKRQIIDVSPSEAAKISYLSPMESVRDALATFSDFSEAIQNKLRSAYALRERLEETSDAEDREDLSTQVFEAFESIERSEAAFLSRNDERAKLLRYFLRMEQAYASFSVGDADGSQKAVKIYEELVAEYPNSPAVYYRLGVAFNKLNDPKTAIQYLSAGYEKLKDDGKSNPTPSAQWLEAAFPRNLAFAYWRSGESLPTEQRRDSLRQAFELAKVSVAAAEPGSQSETRSRNSLLYYGVEYALLADRQFDEHVTKSDIEKNLNVLLTSVDIKTSKDLRKLDTICRACWCLERWDAAYQFASRIEELMRDVNHPSEDIDEKDMLAFALEVLKRKKQNSSAEPNAPQKS